MRMNGERASAMAAIGGESGIHAFLAVAICIAACGGDIRSPNADDNREGGVVPDGGLDGTKDGGPDFTGTDGFDEYVAALVRAQCERTLACGRPGASHPDACVEYYRDNWLAQPWTSAAREGLAMGHLAIDPSKAEACLELVSETPCDTPVADMPQHAVVPGSPCTEILIPKLTTGSPCSDPPVDPAVFPQYTREAVPFPFSSCKGGFCSHEGATCPGTCTEFAAPTESCIDAYCDPREAYCGGATCIAFTDPPLALPGAPCADLRCAFGYACIDNACVAGGTDGDLCAPWPVGPSCAIDHRCVNGACRLGRAWGDDCGTTTDCGNTLTCEGGKCRYADQNEGAPCVLDTECVTGYACVTQADGVSKACEGTVGPGETCSDAKKCADGLLCLSPTKVCGPVPTAVGDVCTWSNLPGACPEGLWCTRDWVCAAVAANGESCTDVRGCASGFCRPVSFVPTFPDYTTPGTCAPLQADGQRCYDAGQCASGRCGLADRSGYSYCATTAGDLQNGVECVDDGQCLSDHCMRGEPPDYKSYCGALNARTDGEACERDTDCVNQCVVDRTDPSQRDMQCGLRCPGDQPE